VSRSDVKIEISIAEQQLRLLRDGVVQRVYPVSTAANGAGERMHSERTPRGAHAVAEKIGAGEPAGTVFVGRRPTGERYSPALAAASPGRDWILTRILWLRGCEPGRNSGGEVDTRARYIYIHGCPDEVALDRPGSRGCIRMANEDICELFDLVHEGTPVSILE